MDPAQTTQSDTSPVTSDPVIPAVPGEYYRYVTTFSTEKPVGFLMKCRANKGRSLEDGDQFPEEHDLTFIFDGGVGVCSPNSAVSVQLMRNFTPPINHSHIVALDISENAFYGLRDQKDAASLMRICQFHRTDLDTVVQLAKGSIIAVRTESGKYGIMRVTEVTPTSISFDACHILQPAQ